MCVYNPAFTVVIVCCSGVLNQCNSNPESPLVAVGPVYLVTSLGMQQRIYITNPEEHLVAVGPVNLVTSLGIVSNSLTKNPESPLVAVGPVLVYLVTSLGIQE